MTNPRRTPSVEIVVGREWRRNGATLNLLAQSSSLRGEEDPLVHVRDVVDVVLDGFNITRPIAEDRVVFLCADLLGGLVSLLRRDLGKSIIAWPEEPWEFTLVPEGDSILVSLYNLGPRNDLVARNHAVDARALLEALRGACATLLKDIERTLPALLGRPLLLRLFEGVAQADALLDEGWEPLPRRAALCAETRANPADRNLERIFSSQRAPIELTLLADTRDADLLAYRGEQPFDQHALLFSGALELCGAPGEKPFVLNGALWLIAQRLLDVLRRRLEWPMSPSTGGGRPRDLGWDGLRLVMEGDAITLSTGDTSLSAPQDAFFSVFTEALLAAESAFLGMNPHLIRNQRFLDLFAEARRLSAWFDDQRAPSTLFESPESTSSDDALESHMARAHADSGVTFPFPDVALRQLKRLRCEPTWAIERPWIGFSQLRRVGERLLVPTLDGLECLELVSGELCWRREATSEDTVVTRAPSIGQVWHASEQLLLIATGERHLSAIDAEDGRERWSREQLHGELIGFDVQGPSVFLATDDGTLESLHAWTGEVRWRVTRRCLFPFGPCVHHGIVFAFGEPVWGGETWLFAFDVTTGRQLWQRVVPHALAARPQVQGDRLLLTLESDDGWLWMAHDMRSGERLWHLHAPFEPLDGLSELILSPDRDAFHMQSDTGLLCCVDSEHGRILWSVALDEATRPSALAGLYRAGDVLLAFHRDAHLVDPRDGTRLCHIEGIVNEPAAALMGPRFELVLGEEQEDGHDRLIVFRTGHFLALLK